MIIQGSVTFKTIVRSKVVDLNDLDMYLKLGWEIQNVYCTSFNSLADLIWPVNLPMPPKLP